MIWAIAGIVIAVLTGIAWIFCRIAALAEPDEDEFWSWTHEGSDAAE